ncbi:RHS repeat-associated core domain-containing protein [Pseudomonas asiatica]|uniref:RHS repeat-associated core domain-containing protein n=1 Tax=Pseudomonas asiatica TaxID=2219225 RepID=A0ABU5L6U7_9PSED|nr:RHS repeat-associated core domain-containing protein [Pseudomonas asiatica]MDZ5741628.1 RHS repeat-associated core domain-containing protein [Pseudomonas asiatica]MDZ5746598.1 RHS repeat-associated core domain-containing protein [Pseudomonas asiatica]MDZ5751876.1 RHS repeat-associated core domain-containing protein [Pseudomonas asiatica]MDZ5756997.1 RHS repeat-associated core domain-containing protein [Pseudomonas asiatica]
MKYTRFFMQHDRVHTALSGDAAVVCMRGQAGVLAETRLEQETARSALLAADSGDSVVGVRSQGQPEAVTYNAYGYHNPNDIPLHRPAFNGHLLLWYLYLLGNGYRAFNPVLMCFQSPDSQSPFGAGGLNCYAYCAGDPVNFSDPSGHVRSRSSSPPRNMSPATQERIVLEALNSQPGWNTAGVKRRRLSSATEERIVREVLNTQPGWNASVAPVQSGSRHDLALTSDQAQLLPSTSSAVSSVASSSGAARAIEKMDAWTERRTPLSSARVAFLKKFNERNKRPIKGLDIVQTKGLFEIAISTLGEGGSVRGTLMAAKRDLTDDQVHNIRSRIRYELSFLRANPN